MPRPRQGGTGWYLRPGKWQGLNPFPADELQIFLRSCLLVRRRKADAGVLSKPLPQVIRQPLRLPLPAAAREERDSMAERRCSL